MSVSSADELATLERLSREGKPWNEMVDALPGRTVHACRIRLSRPTNTVREEEETHAQNRRENAEYSS